MAAAAYWCPVSVFPLFFFSDHFLEFLSVGHFLDVLLCFFLFCVFVVEVGYFLHFLGDVQVGVRFVFLVVGAVVCGDVVVQLVDADFAIIYCVGGSLVG